MAKLNYANRKSEGLKLAHIVAKDLRKKASSSPSKNDNSPIELNLGGKAIPDEGLQEISAALIEVLQKAHAESRLNCQLEELHLPNNALSALGLKHLAPAIRLAGPWLKDVDLSDNFIIVHTTEQCLAWEQFLDAFGMCRVLRRLEMSGNDFSGTHAFEILTRIYFRHAPYDPAADRCVEIALADSEDHSTSELTASIKELTLANASTTSNYREGCGLRYVPYIVVSNVKMDNAGCFQLSYILPRHVEPQHLLEPLKPGQAKQLLDNYDHRSGCSGIIYTTEKLTQYGVKLLEYCEKQRAELVQAEIEEEEGDSSEQSSPPRDERPPTPPSAFASMLAPRHKHGTPRRRSSIVSGDSAAAAAAAAASRKGSTFDAESVQWKLQRETIEKYGLNGVELWHTAMRLLVLARAMLPPSVLSPALNTSPPATTLPNTPRKIPLPMPAQQGRHDSVVSTVNMHRQAEGNCWRDPNMLFELPLKIWRRIMAEAVEAQGILSDTQIDNVLAYAADRATLAKERESVRNPVSNQKWMVIDAMGCLAYEMTL